MATELQWSAATEEAEEGELLPFYSPSLPHLLLFFLYFLPCILPYFCTLHFTSLLDFPIHGLGKP